MRNKKAKQLRKLAGAQREETTKYEAIPNTIRQRMVEDKVMQEDGTFITQDRVGCTTATLRLVAGSRTVLKGLKKFYRNATTSKGYSRAAV